MILSAIYVYPIKSLSGIPLVRAKVQPIGLQHDRRWIVVDAKGEMMTQREHPHMALAKVMLEPKGLRVQAPNLPILRVPFDIDTTNRMNIRVWHSELNAPLVSEEASRWFTKFLGQTAHLVYMSDEVHRAVDSQYAISDADQVSFADGFPFLLTNHSSLKDLNAKLDRTISMLRFRPNLVVDGAAPFEEDEWRTIDIGGMRFHLVKDCARCAMTTVHPERGEFDGKEPLQTLSSYRLKNQKAMFGRNVIVESPVGEIAIGDQVNVIELTPD
jgi:uncharacterized protein YcbX